MAGLFPRFSFLSTIDVFSMLSYEFGRNVKLNLLNDHLKEAWSFDVCILKNMGNSA
jgi:hypothetical protein